MSELSRKPQIAIPAIILLGGLASAGANAVIPDYDFSAPPREENAQPNPSGLASEQQNFSPAPLTAPYVVSDRYANGTITTTYQDAKKIIITRETCDENKYIYVASTGLIAVLYLESVCRDGNISRKEWRSGQSNKYSRFTTYPMDEFAGSFFTAVDRNSSIADAYLPDTELSIADIQHEPFSRTSYAGGHRYTSHYERGAGPDGSLTEPFRLTEQTDTYCAQGRLVIKHTDAYGKVAKSIDKQGYGCTDGKIEQSEFAELPEPVLSREIQEQIE